MASSGRLARYRGVSSALDALGDGGLEELAGGAREVAVGIGGSSAVVDVAGVPVFVKRIPLTDVERRPENVMSTANLFGLPPFYQYGVGSAGFGAWRELTANQWATGCFRKRPAKMACSTRRSSSVCRASANPTTRESCP